MLENWRIIARGGNSHRNVLRIFSKAARESAEATGSRITHSVWPNVIVLRGHIFNKLAGSVIISRDVTAYYGKRIEFRKTYDRVLRNSHYESI